MLPNAMKAGRISL